MVTITVLVGSTRKGSVNEALFETMKAFAPEGVEFLKPDLDSLPMYNGDMEKEAFPESAKVLKDAMRKSAGVILITPEYNRSTTPLLKNAIDWASRPYGDSAWEGKPVATMGATGGTIGTSAAQQHLKQILAYLNTKIMGQPEFYLSGVTKKIGPDGLISDEDTRNYITTFIEAFLVHSKTS